MAEGRANPAYRYASREALELLGPEIVAGAEQDEALGLARIPAATVRDGLADLLTLHVAEVVVQRIAAVARDDALTAASGAGRRWPRRFVSTLARGGRAQRV